jgi:hypothetical protein
VAATVFPATQNVEFGLLTEPLHVLGMVSVFTLVVLGLSAHVNHFMGFFCKYFHQPEDEGK